MKNTIYLLLVLLFYSCQSKETKLRNLILCKKQTEKELLKLEFKHDSILLSRKPNIKIVRDYSKYDTEANIKHESRRVEKLYDSLMLANFRYDTMKINLDYYYLILKSPLVKKLDSIKTEIGILKSIN